MEHLSLLELNHIIGDVLAKNLEPSYWVVAEISELRTNQKGHCYLELVEKDNDAIKAKTRATIWSYTYRNLSGWFEALTGQSLRAGMKILCNATVQFHEVYGFSLNIRDIDAQYTLGERAKKRQETIARLQGDGIFDMNKELTLPTVPQRIAVISSETAAGFGDFMDQLRHNEYGYVFSVKLFNALMQGAQAEQSIIQAMHQVFHAQDDFDLLVIIRGGGASLDLDCFDGYELGSHIAQFPLPVITGIGHERDETIADLVAHTKMKTPTATAEFIISGVSNFEVMLDNQRAQLYELISNRLSQQQNKLEQLAFYFQKYGQEQLTKKLLSIQKALYALHNGTRKALKIHEIRISEMQNTLMIKPMGTIHIQEERLAHYEKELSILNPEKVLKRGYTLTKINGKNIHKIHDFEEGAEIITITDQRKIKSKYISENERK